MGQQDSEQTGGADPLELVIVQRMDGFPAHLRRLPDGSQVLEGIHGRPLPALSAGERLRVTRPVLGDATYVQPARVLRVDVDDATATIKTDGDPEREQQRGFVRVTAPTIEVAVIPEPGHGEASGGILHDLSADGVRAVLEEGELNVGARMRLRFGLPRANGGLMDMELECEVVWVDTPDVDEGSVGIQFLNTDKDTKSKLLKWVFQQEARNARETR